MQAHLKAAQAKARPKLLKELAKPTLTKRKRKHGHTTLAIRNAGESAAMKVITLNKVIGKLKVKCLEIPHYA